MFFIQMSEFIFDWRIVACCGSVRSTNAIPNGGVLPIITFAVSVVKRMMFCTIDNPSPRVTSTGKIKTIVNGDCPKLNGHHHGEIKPVVKRKEKRKDVVGYTLHKSIDRMKCIGCKRRRIKKVVVERVKPFVERLHVEPAMCPVNHEISKDDKPWNGEEKVSPSIFIHVRINTSVTFGVKHIDGSNHGSQWWHSLVAHFDLFPNAPFFDYSLFFGQEFTFEHMEKQQIRRTGKNPIGKESANKKHKKVGTE
mmetsp:Transcript_13055/g.19725  ORF Transcript_13055/g.19725 Transcript_13055/m.19725 type:complete len:251 (-) Transcript_13055:124-876(-)